MLKAHNVLQRAKQTVFGTPVTTATEKLQNVSSFTLQPDLQTRQVDRLTGTLAPTHTTTLDYYGSKANFDVSDETFEDVNFWLESLFSSASPTGTGPYVRSYAAPLTSVTSPKFMTLQFGQSGSVMQQQDASISSLTLSGSNNAGVSVSGTIIGGKVVAGSLASLADRTGTTRMSGCMASLAIDSWTGTMGATDVPTSAYAWELTVNSNREYMTTLGACTPNKWNDKNWSGQLKLSLDVNTTTQAYLTSIFAATNAILEKQIQIKYSVGTGVDLRELIIQFCGHTLSAPDLYADRSGILTYDLMFSGVYNPTFANWLKISTSSNIASI